MKPLLTIGIIFKNEIRCLERCLKSLQPLRDAVPCEVVMADTGSCDGSRAVAGKYADLLFDFPWINDFAAARNALVDRCSGEWFLTIDADEWLTDVSELVDFFTCGDAQKHEYCAVVVRNYFDSELDEEYSDFLTVRMVRLSTGARYTGAIHEAWDRCGHIYGLGRTILHHDGYVDSVKKQGNKTERNMKPLLEELERNPEDLKALLQCIESGQGTPSYERFIRQAAAVVEKKPPQWEYFGPPILRFAVHWAASRGLPELERWTSEVLEWFPDSVYTNIDVAFALLADHVQKQEHTQAIAMGERYLEALDNYRKGQFDYRDLIFSTLLSATQSKEYNARIILADQYFQEKQPEKAREMLLSVDGFRIPPSLAEDYVGIMMNLHAQGVDDFSPALADFWEKNGPERKQGPECRKAMAETAESAFFAGYRQAEDKQGLRHAYTLFLPLAGKCETGNAAKILASQTPWDLTAALEAVEDWTALPIPALSHAIENGVPFPLPQRPLNLEAMDDLAARLSWDPAQLAAALERASGDADTPQSLAWAARLALAAVQVSKWEDEARGMRLARTFAELESKFLPLCYAADAPFLLLPPLHRFGKCCAQAFAALENGNTVEYVRHLRQGLETCPSMKPMAEFLLDHTPELQAPAPDPELLALAEKVRTLLASFPPEDPSVAALKASPVYQRVAHLIEEDAV